MLQMDQKYDCTKDVLEHKGCVSFWIHWIIDVLEYRAQHHDESKLDPPEKAIFDEYTPRLKELEFGSDEYKVALEKMGEGLAHHYKFNSHHPEHFKNGIDDMSIWDIVEIFADWMAATSTKNANMDLDYLQSRFGLSPQLCNILANTLWAADMDDINMRIPMDFQQRTNFLRTDYYSAERAPLPAGGGVSTNDER